MPLGIGLYQLSRRRIHGAKFISKKKQLISFDIVLRHPSTFHIGNREMEHCRWKVGDSLIDTSGLVEISRYSFAIFIHFGAAGADYVPQGGTFGACVGAVSSKNSC